MNKQALRAFPLLLLVAIPSAVAARFTTSFGSSVQFRVHGPAGMIIVGQSSALALNEQSGTLVFEVPIATLATGNELESRKMRAALGVNSFPTAVLKVARNKLILPDEGEQQSGNVTGQLTLHGVTRSVSVHYRATQDVDATYVVTGHLDIDMTQFEITPPSYLGLPVQPGVSIDVAFHATDD